MKLDHITLLWRDMGACARYYDALLPLLGFRRLREHVWTDDDGFFFQFRAAHSETPAYQRYAPGLNHLGFAAPTAQAVHAIRARMAEAGFEVPEIQDLGGVTALFMKDPDGVRFEISHTPPGLSVVD